MADTEVPSRFPGGGGSTRDTVAHQAILESTRTLLAEHGYAKLTIEAIAQRAGVGKPTIYRWWPSKAAVVYEAVWGPPAELPPDSGDLETDLRTIVSRLVDHFSRDEVIAAFPGLVSDVIGGAKGVAIVGEFSERSLRHLRSVLLAARSRGELRDDVDVGAVVDLVMGAVLSRMLARRLNGRSIAPALRRLTDDVVEIVLHGIARRRSSKRTV